MSDYFCGAECQSTDRPQAAYGRDAFRQGLRAAIPSAMQHNVNVTGINLGIASRIAAYEPPPPTVKAIQKYVASHYSMRWKDMRSAKRTWDVGHPRQLAMYLSRKLTMHSLPKLGELFGGKHHTTVLHGIRAVEKQMRGDPAFKAQVTSMLEELLG